MAEVRNDFQWDEDTGDGRVRHPWGQWLDGQTWVLTLGVDFFCDMRSMQAQVLTRARLVGGRAATRRLNDSELAVRFIEMEEDGA